jgi:hypothetical protein
MHKQINAKKQHQDAQTDRTEKQTDTAHRYRPS